MILVELPFEPGQQRKTDHRVEVEASVPHIVEIGHDQRAGAGRPHRADIERYAGRRVCLRRAAEPDRLVQRR